MICSHFFRSQAKLLLVVPSMRGARALAEHHHGAAGRAAPALLRRADQHVHAGGLHVDPHRAGGDAVEHEQAADLVHRVGHGAQVVVGQDHAGGGFHVRREHHGGLLGADGGHHLVDRRGREGRLRPSPMRRAFSTVPAAGIRPISKICVQR
jgi:hypothetical protein